MQGMMEFFKHLTQLSQTEAWAVQVFLIIFTTLLLKLAKDKVFLRLEAQSQKTANIWDDVFVDASSRPVGWIIYLYGFTFAVQSIKDLTENDFIFSAIEPARKIGVIAISIWFVIRLSRLIEDQLIDPNVGKKAYDETTVRAVGKLLRAALVITTVLVGLQSIGVPVSGVLAFGGIGGIAIGYAAKDLLANFFGGMMIYLDRPFAIGDWIRSPDKNIEGTVENIGWRSCRIRTFDKRPLYVPNSIFTTISVENPSRMRNRRIRTVIGLRYDDAAKLPQALADIKTMLQSHPEIDTTQTLMVNFIEFGPSSLDFMIYTFTKTTDWVKFQDVQQDVFFKVIDIVEQHGAEIAFPTQTLYLNNVEAQKATAS